MIDTPRPQPSLAALVADTNRMSGRRIAVLDDDPTGSQCVHDVAVATVLETEQLAAGLANAGDTCFLLTNTRGMQEDEAVVLTRETLHKLFSLDLPGPLDIVSRSDSTLRGHVVAEVEAIADEYNKVTGNGVDGVIFCPAMIEAGRTTIDDVHYARIGDGVVPVGESEFAQDATFGYRSSNLRDFLREKGATTGITSLSLDVIRHGGPSAVAEILGRVTQLEWVIANAATYSDLEIVVLGLRQAQQEGKNFIYRTGPSFVRPLAGLESAEPLNPATIPIDADRGEHGLVVVGSHVGQTTRQVRAAQAQGALAEVELEVTEVLGEHRDEYLAEAVGRVAGALRETDVLVYTSRELVTGDSAESSLQLSMRVSAALVQVVSEARKAKPAWVIAKGGITSHEVAVKGLGIRRATVAGQFLPGQISLFIPEEAPDEVMGCPYVVFPGNVGGEGDLAAVISTLRDAVGRSRSGLER
ncbi:four-carbon acid sugar kinase family protein [Nesterenkonia lutea]|uniref:Uncharacterized protein YgbK (DUF1537 family) n=1 Tax=Nesterenkonia lutea TaxID=272919 RepID=A0ABR9JCY3_9MICC|nr:four-carbon acid sugar kinase family protein [Nesterenkonia lutea]MBE1523676.1 uncharacterized protein YgbK (DUF1537 family) [Nesterenkonia lutea]